MLNNKAYALTPVILLLLFVIALSSYYHSSNIDELLYNGLLSEIAVAKYSFALDNDLASIIAFETVKSYNLLSNAKALPDLNSLISNNTKGYSIGNNGVVIFVYAPVQKVSEPWINMSIPYYSVNKTLFYPVISLIEERNNFRPELIQECLSSLGCSSQNFNSVISTCLDWYSSSAKFRLINTSIPKLISNRFNLSLGFVNDNNITKLFPYNVGNYTFNC